MGWLGGVRCGVDWGRGGEWSGVVPVAEGPGEVPEFDGVVDGGDEAHGCWVWGLVEWLGGCGVLMRRCR